MLLLVQTATNGGMMRRIGLIGGLILLSGLASAGSVAAQDSVPKVECSAEHPCFRVVGPGATSNAVTERCTEVTIERSITGANGPRQERIPLLQCALPSSSGR